MASPYADRPPRSFWRTGVAGQDPGWIDDLYRPRFRIDAKTRLATAGSCFAQHLGRRLRDHGGRVLDVEPAPNGLPDDVARSYGYGVYSARYGNIYTARQLAQLAQEALGRWRPSDIVWERSGRFYDALRPGVEPAGLDSPREVRAHRADHLRRVRRLLRRADVFVFTLGLTEAWVHAPSGTVYPTAPETIAGTYDPRIHALVNFTAAEVAADLEEFRTVAQSVNPRLRLLLTVSPVPVVATATDAHVLAASVYSKSTLRAAAGQLQDAFDDVDYFPAYELVATPFLRRELFAPNLRSVTEEGLDLVMSHFLARHELPRPGRAALAPAADDGDEECEEALLEAFGT